MPQLIPDGLEPGVHLQVALATVHPVKRPPYVEGHVRAALSIANPSADHVNFRRAELVNLLIELAQEVHIKS